MPQLERIPEEQLPKLEDGQFPPNCESDEDRYRFRLCWGIAQKMMEEDDGPNVWQMARSVYQNPAFTL